MKKEVIHYLYVNKEVKYKDPKSSLCGHYGVNNTTENWDKTTCKLCLQLKKYNQWIIEI